MKKLMSMLVVVAVAAVTEALAEVKTAAQFERTAITVTSGQTQTETGPLMHDSDKSGFDKDGAGEYTLPLGTVLQKSALDMAVRQGTVRLVDNGTTAAVSAPDCMQKAAMWLMASDCAGDSSSVGRWLDHREVSVDQNKYPCANQATAANQPTTETDASGKKWMYFGGKNSGKWASFMNAARSGGQTINATHAFALVKLVSSYGFIFGANQNNYATFHPEKASGDLAGSYWHGSECCPSVMAGQTYLDGIRIDGTTTGVKAGVQLVEWEAATRSVPLMNFFNDRGITGRFGGDYIGEVVIFDKRLTNAERLEVEAYLMQKWESGAKPSSVKMAIASGATVELADGLTAAPTVVGNGMVVKGTSGVLHYADAVQGKSDSTWRLERGTMELEQGATRLAVASGDVFTGSRDAYWVSTLSRATGTTGEVSVNGGGAIRLESVPSDVSKLTVSCGSLALGATAEPSDGSTVPATAVPSEVCATMNNANFEGFVGEKWIYAETTDAQWTLNPNGNGAFMVFQKGQNQQTTYMGENNPPEGIQSMGFDFYNTSAIGATASAKTSVSFPSDGDYIFTFRDITRLNAQSGTRVDITLTDANQSVRNIASFYAAPGSSNTDYRRERYLVRGVKAGTYTFTIGFTHTVAGEKLTVFDDFKFKLADTSALETVFPVPNGDFEQHAFTTATSFDSGCTATGWTFVNPTAGNMADVGPLAPTMNATIGTMSVPWYIGNNVQYGQCQLAFFGNQGKATSAAFVPPAGKWRLRFRAVRQSSGMVNWNGVSVNGAANVAVKATVGDGTTEALGSIAVGDTVFRGFTLARTFACDGTQPVVLEVTQTTSGANVRIDDLELVRDDNLIYNGNFDTIGGDSKAGWTTASWTEMPNFSQYYGKTVIDGRALIITGQGSAEQEIEFSEAGVYRLSFWARGRAHYVDDTSDPLMSFAQNRLRFYLKSGDDEDEIYRTEKLNSTNFVHYTALFPVAAVGRYTFGFRGTETGDRNAWIDLVSVKKVSAAAAPEIPAKTDIDICLADGEKLRLDYTGSTTVHELKVNGCRLYGEVSAATYPDYVTGPGSITATYRPGLLLIVK